MKNRTRSGSVQIESVFKFLNRFKHLKIIYFRKNTCFISAFEKSKRFIYIEGKKAEILKTNNAYWED